MSKVWIYLTDDLSGPDDIFVRENIKHLPLIRQEKCARYQHNVDKRACILSYLLLAKGLREQYGIGSCGEFVYNEHGKPYLKDYPQVYFNLSHCKQGVVCALADVEVGIDIQDIRPFNIDVARRVCCDKEMLELYESGDPARIFCRIWTEKESYAKANGVSVFSVLQQDLPVKRTAYLETMHYCMSLCCKENGGEAVCEIVKVP